MRNENGYDLQTDWMTRDDISEQGCNVLSGKKISVCDSSGHCLTPLWGFDKNLLVQSDVYQHIDIRGEMPVYISVDLEEIVSIDTVIYGGAYSSNKDFCTSEYELYCGLDSVNLFKDESCIAHYNNDGVWRHDIKGSGSIQLFRFNEKIIGRFFGIKIIRANPTDDIIRIARLEAYSKAYTAQRAVLKKLGRNLLSDAYLEEVKIEKGGQRNINIWPLYGDWEFLTDGIFGSKCRQIKLETGHFPVCFTYRLHMPVTPTTLVVAGCSSVIPDIKLYFSEKENELYDKAAELENSRIEWISDSEWIYFADIKSAEAVSVAGICMKTNEPDHSDIILDQIAVISTLRNIEVDPDQIINEDFMGNGANVIPFSLMPGNIMAGYTKAHWLKDARNILTVRPAMVRVWVQIDWMEKEKGVYDFDTPEMNGLCEYIRVFQKAETEVQLTFSWKAGEAVHHWYCIEGVVAVNSAPADIHAFAASCSELLRYLWGQGLENVKHLAIANEPGTDADFACHGDVKQYYAKTIKALDKKLKKDGIREKVKLWGPESSEGFDFVEFCAANLSEYLDCYSHHWYVPTPEEVGTLTERAKSIGATPFVISECFEKQSGSKAWGRSLAGYVIYNANQGGSGVLMWTLHGVKSMSDTRPDRWALEGHTNLWNAQLNGGSFNIIYYSFGMLCRYIPAHSKVVAVTNTNSDMRIAAFITPGGDYTIVAECRKVDSPRALNIRFINPVKKVFYKHMYVPDVETFTEPNGILPPVVESYLCENELYDNNLSSEYTVVVYTTLPPAAQVRLSEAHAVLKPGESLALTAEAVDSTQDIVWSVAFGRGEISQQGVYMAPSDAEVGSRFAIKAALKNDEQAHNICLVEIV